jgi:hypothetical protein
MPAQAGIHFSWHYRIKENLDSGQHRNDEKR